MKDIGSIFLSFFCAKFSMASFDLLPSNSYTFHPSTKTKVGYPVMLNRKARAFSFEPSTLATFILRSFPLFIPCSVSATFSYVAANFLQCLIVNRMNQKHQSKGRELSLRMKKLKVKGGCEHFFGSMTYPHHGE